MKIKFLLLYGSALLIIICSSTFYSLGQGKVQFKSHKDSISYIIGTFNGENLKKQNIDINPDLFFVGLTDVLNGKPSLIAKAESEALLNRFQKEQQARQQESMAKQSQTNREEGRQFLANNKTKKDITELPSGLQYKIIKPGSGESPTLTDKVTVNYRGTLLDGTKFDDSYDRGQPATFPLNGVIKGWTEGLQFMKIGAIYQFFIPTDLAYGDRAAGPIIQAGSTLIFEIELISFEPADTTVNPK